MIASSSMIAPGLDDDWRLMMLNDSFPAAGELGVCINKPELVLLFEHDKLII